MTTRVNAYFAALLITAYGAGAALLIIHFAYTNAYAIAVGSTPSPYSAVGR